MRASPLPFLDALNEWRSFSPGLARMNQALEELNLKDPRFRVITVGGTNGKGTVATSIASGMGGKVGLFTSPHLRDVRERISIDGRPVSDDLWIKAYQTILSSVTRSEFSYFEWLMLLCVVIFDHENVTLGVFEVGLGGRLDAVNSLDPDIAILTSVALDHQAILGSTLEAIALEKIEIARPEKPVILPTQVYELPGIADRITQIGAKPMVIPDAPGTRQNTMILRAFSELVGLERVIELHPPPGRRQIIRRDPLLIIDGAHNQAAWRYLAQWVSHKQLHLNVLCSVSHGRDPLVMTTELDKIAKMFHVWQAGFPGEVAWDQWPVERCRLIDEPKLDRLLEEPLLVCGSFYLLGAFLERFEGLLGDIDI